MGGVCPLLHEINLDPRWSTTWPQPPVGRFLPTYPRFAEDPGRRLTPGGFAVN